MAQQALTPNQAKRLRYRVFLQSNHDMPGENNINWVGAWQLGYGGMGMAGLWIQQNQQGRIIRRIVVKEATPSPAAWNRPSNWAGQVGTSEPREVDVHRRLTVARVDGFVTYLNHRVYLQRQRYRIYMQFCPHGNLEELIFAHLRALRPGNEHRRTVAEEREYMIPEPFVWRLLERLMQAAKVAEDRAGQTIMGDKLQYIHQDLKPSNIFFAEPDVDNFPTYPLPKIGDFDAGRFTWPTDPQNPNAFRQDPRTRGFIAPEQSSHLVPLSMMRLSAMNFWQIGMTIAAVISVMPYPPQTRYTHDGTNITSPDYNVNAYANPHYSDDLKDAVQSCLVSDPDRRRAPWRMIRRIRRDDRFDGMRTYGRDRRRGWRSSRHLLRISMADRYRAGLSLRHAPQLVLLQVQEDRPQQIRRKPAAV